MSPALISRIFAAVLGGYGLATLFSVAVLVRPGPAPEAVLAGMVASFLVYTGAVIWVFAVRSAWRAWGGLLLCAALLLPAACWVWLRGSP